MEGTEDPVKNCQIDIRDHPGGISSCLITGLHDPGARPKTSLVPARTLCHGNGARVGVWTMASVRLSTWTPFAAKWRVASRALAGTRMETAVAKR